MTENIILEEMHVFLQVGSLQIQPNAFVENIVWAVYCLKCKTDIPYVNNTNYHVKGET